MKKLLSALSACVLMMLSFCIPVSAEEQAVTPECEVIRKIANVIRVEHYSPIEMPYVICNEWESTNGIFVCPQADVTVNVGSFFTLFFQALEKHGITTEGMVVSSEYYSTIGRESPEYTLGDITDEGGVQIDDAQAVLRGYASWAASGETGLTEAQGYAADVDGNGEVSLDDAQHILRYYTLNTLGQRNVGWVDIVVFGA